MKRLNDKKYRQALKSVHEPFDKMALWEAIDDQLAEKEKPRVLPWWIGNLIVLLFIGVIGFQYFEATYDSQNNKQVTESGIETNNLTQGQVFDFPNAGTNSIPNSASVPVPDFAKAKINKKVLDKQSGTPPPRYNGSVALSETSSNERIAMPLPMQLRKPRATDEKEEIAKSSAGASPANARRNQSTKASPKLPGKEIVPLVNPSLPAINTAHTPKWIVPKQKTRFAYGLATYGAMLNRNLSTENPETQDYLRARRDKEKSLYLTGVNVEIASRLKPQWELIAAVQWQRLVTRFNAEEITIDQQQVATDSAYYFPQGGSNIYYPGTIKRSVITTRVVQQYNHTHQVGLSVGLRYLSHIAKVPVYLQSQVIYNGLQWTRGKMINQDLQIVGYAIGTDLAIEVKPKFATQLGAGVRWPVSSRWQLFAGIQWQRDLSLKVKPEVLYIQDSALGITFGLKSKGF